MDPAADRTVMVGYFVWGFAALVVFALLFMVSLGNIMLATAGGVLVWSGLGPIWFEFDPVVTYGPCALLMGLGLMAVVKKFA